MNATPITNRDIIVSLVEACLAGKRYMAAVAIASASQPESVNLWRTVEGDNLDDLFERWLELTDEALKKAGAH